MLITIEEYANKIGLSKNTIYSAIHRGRIKPERVDGVYYIDSEYEWISKKRMVRDNVDYSGISYTPIYKLWIGMRTRCYNKNTPYYERYGGRGIIVCDEWLNNPIVFYEWAISHGYKKGLQLDRVDNNGNYSPDNCRFVTPKVNAKNRRKMNEPRKYVGEDADRLIAERIEKYRKKFSSDINLGGIGYASTKCPKDLFDDGVFDDLFEEHLNRMKRT